MFSLCGGEWSLCRNSFHQGQPDSDRGGRAGWGVGGGWSLEDPMVQNTSPPAGQHKHHTTISCSPLTSITFGIMQAQKSGQWARDAKAPACTLYRNTQYYGYSDECRWQLAPQQDALVNADCGGSQQKSRAVESVGNTVADTVISIKWCRSGSTVT